jgi:predicted secreted hydrolase
LVDENGNTTHLSHDRIEISGLDQWVSPSTDAVYPSTWSISIPSRNIELLVEPWILDQEMNISIIYWEGAVRIEGVSEGSPVTGEGYVELTGYAQTLQGVF